MDQCNWSAGLCASDQTVKSSVPDRKHVAGNVMEGRVSVHAVSRGNVNIITFLITEFLLFGFGSWLAYREIRKMSSAVLGAVMLPGLCEAMCRSINTWTWMLCDQNH